MPNNNWLDEHWKKAHNPNYLGTFYFNDVLGAGANATITRLAQEQVFNPSSRREEQCNVAHFAEGILPLILNKTACKFLSALSGDNRPRAWVGAKIFIEVKKEKVKGKLETVLRLGDYRAGHISQAAPQPPAPPEPSRIHCEDCNNFLTPFDRDGKTYSPQQLAKSTQKLHGKDLCLDCLDRAEGRKEAGENNMEGFNDDTNS